MDAASGLLALKRLLQPRTIAIAGVSDRPGALGTTVLENLLRFDFAGEIHLIHPGRTMLAGRPAVPGAADLPYGVDCVVLAIPVAAILDAVLACAANGVGGVVIFAAGFAELGAEGRALQERIAAVAHGAGMVIEGPNCLGFVNHVAGVPLTFAAIDARPPVTRPAIAVLSQSGAMATALRAALQGRALDVSYAISTGNEASHGLEDFAELLIADGHTRVLCLVAEHIRNPQRFLAFAGEAATRGIPIVMLHPGSSQAAKVSARTHTGAMTGAHEVMLAHVRRVGVIVADTIEELCDMAELLHRSLHHPHGGTAVLAESGAFKAQALDYAERIGLTLPQPQGHAAAELDAIAPGFIVASNPLDLTAQALGDPGLYSRAAALLTADPGVGSLLVCIILTSPRMTERKMPPVMEMMREAASRLCVVFAMLGDETCLPAEAIAQMRSAGVVVHASPERALRALASLARRHPANPAAAAWTAPAPRLPQGTMAEHAAKMVLAASGLAVPAGALCIDAAEAAQTATRIGYPVALKIQSADLSHKSDIGGVVLNLCGVDALHAAWPVLMARVRAAAPQAHIDGVLVERMSGSGLEMIVGARRDPLWGVVVTVGLGGVLAEIMQDVRVLTPDLSPAEIAAELRQLRGARLLGLHRGRPARDVEAVCLAVGRITRFMVVHPEVEELDINPLMVGAEGEGAVALDALISVRGDAQ